jgi:uncharacterized RDD family membrane protein YckC
MSEPFWHYTDAQGVELGPVPADAVRAAFHGGRLGPASQFWHEGLPGWIDLVAASAELGLGAAAAPPDPYAAPRARIESATTFAPGTDVVPAGFVRRFAAMFLDQLVLGAVYFVLMMLVGVAAAIGGGSDGGEPGTGVIVLIYAIGIVGGALYYTLQESSAAQATLGKRALGIKVVDRDGRQLSYAHALGRWFSVAVSYLTMYLGFLMAAFPPRKAALHDLVSGTQVVDRYAYTATPERQQRELSGCLVFAAVGIVLVPFALAIVAAIGVAQFERYKQGSGAIDPAPPAPVAARR